MPKLGMEPIRRDALVKATIREVGLRGSTDVTVSQIAKSAGMSSALAHHYFGGKEQILSAAMRHILALYGGEARAALSTAGTPRERIAAILRASFAPSNFGAEVVSAWLIFYVQAQTSPEARRLLTIYQRRLRSNLRHAIRGIAPARAADVAETLAALIDGIYLRAALDPGGPDPRAALARATEATEAILAREVQA
jgi:TetR/AcrR family transcriptional regulator, transcriptional repressor of bet genes